MSLLYVVNDDTPLYLKFAWTQKPNKGRPGLTNDQKLALDLVLLGGPKTLIEVADFLGTDRTTKSWEKNLKGRVMRPLLDMDLLVWEDENESTLRLAGSFEASLHRIFVGSGGQSWLRSR